MEKSSKHIKLKRMQQLEQDLEKRGEYIDELFQRKTIRVLDEIAYLTTMCGVIKVGADCLANNNLYTRLKTLFNARKGSLSNFRTFIGVIYGKMKKIKSDANISLSHVQIEAIMYNSLNALLSMSNVKCDY